MTRITVAALFVLVTTPIDAQPLVSLRLTAVWAGDGGAVLGVRVAPPGAADDQAVFSDRDGGVSVDARPGTDLRVSKAGYAPRLVRVPPEQRTMDVRLAPAAVITGLVIDSNGAPGTRIGVVVRRLAPIDAATPAQVQLVTDDRGEFRAGGLSAGRYEVYTERGLNMTGVLDNLPPGGAPEAMAERVRRGREAASSILTVTLAAGNHSDVTVMHPAPSIEFPFSEGGIVTGRIMDEFGEPAERARVTLIATGTGGHVSVTTIADDLGRFRLYQVEPRRYLLVVTEADSSPPIGGTYLPARGNAVSQRLPVYYPGTSNPAEAASLSIERGREMSGMDMVFRMTRGVRVFGTITPVTGTTQRSVALKSAAPWAVVALGNRSGAVRADGSFELTNVPPGEYSVQALASAPAPGGGRTAFSFASRGIVVGSDDVGPIVLTPSPTSSVSGRITLEGGREGTTANEFRLAVLPVDPAAAPEPSSIGGGARFGGGAFIPDGTEPDSDWTFHIDGLAGPTRIGLARAPQGWWLKEVRIGGRNAAYEPAPFGAPGDSRNDVVIVLSARGAEIGGRATDGDNMPVGLYTVVAFAPEPGRWFKGSPVVRTAAPRPDGSYVLASLPPGDYLVAAAEFSELDPNGDDLQQPEALARLASSARRVTVAANQQHLIDLTISTNAR